MRGTEKGRKIKLLVSEQGCSKYCCRHVSQVEEETLRGYKYSTGIGKLIVAALLERQMQLRLNDRPRLSQAHKICCGHLKLVFF